MSGSASASDEIDPEGGARWRDHLWRFLSLFVLSGFAIAQPLLDVFGRAPEQFVFRGATGADVVAFAAVVVLVPAVVLWAISVAGGMVWRPLGAGLHATFAGLLIAAIVVQLLRPTLEGAALAVLALAIGAGGVWLLRTDAARQWVGFASIAPLLFGALFLTTSDASLLLESEGSAAATVEVRDPVPTIMIILDELPLESLIDETGEIDADLYPTFAQLATESTWFRNTTAVSNATITAVPAILTAQFPTGRDPALLAAHPDNLFTLLGGAMPLEVAETLTQLCPRSLCQPAAPADGGLAPLLRDARRALADRLALHPVQNDVTAGFGEVIDADVPVAIPDLGPEEVTQNPLVAQSDDRLARFVESLDREGPALHFLHLLLPHAPYYRLPDGTRYLGANTLLGRPADTWADDQQLVDLGRQRHLLQLTYADALLGDIFDRLRASDRYDESLVVVVADHGMSFRPGQPSRGLDLDVPLGDEAAADLMWVPFFVKEPGQTEGSTSDRPTTTLDVLPTIADVLGVEIPWDHAGRSAFGPAGPDVETRQMLQSAVLAERAGIDIEVDSDAGWRTVLDNAVTRFAPDGGPEALFTIGPRPDLLGTPATGPGLAALDAALDPTAELDDVSLASRVLPAFVYATVTGASRGDEVAVAVNGTIRATTTVYADGDVLGVAAVVPPESFVDGANEVRFLRITG